MEGRSRDTVIIYLTDEATQATINCKLFKKLFRLNNAVDEVELTKAKIEHNETISFGIFVLQYAKLRMLEMYDYFSTMFLT